MTSNFVLKLTYQEKEYTFLVVKFVFGPASLIKVVDVKNDRERILSDDELDALIISNPLMPFELNEIIERIENNVTVQ